MGDPALIRRASYVSFVISNHRRTAGMTIQGVYGADGYEDNDDSAFLHMHV